MGLEAAHFLTDHLLDDRLQERAVLQVHVVLDAGHQEGGDHRGQAQLLIRPQALISQSLQLGFYLPWHVGGDFLGIRCIERRPVTG